MTTTETPHRLFQIVLRTLDAAAARTFYAAVLGGDGASLNIVPLHEAAIARGAKPHWLGFVEVDDVNAATATFTQSGASALGPPWVNPEGLQASVMRDPGGALIALAKPPPSKKITAAPEVGSYVLNTPDVETAKKSYGQLLGWSFGAPTPVEGHGVFHPFSWQPGEAPVGSFGDTAGRPGVHPHWLFALHVSSLETAVSAVRAGGGTVAAQLTLPTGERMAVCDDAQGAAFGLRQPAR